MFSKVVHGLMKNKKLNSIGIFLIIVIGILVVGFIVLGLIVFWNKVDSKEDVAVYEKKENKENKEESLVVFSENLENKSQEKNEKEIGYTEYVNQGYKYSIKFPDNWYMNNDLSETNLTEIEIDDEGTKMMIGGQTFWSNYENIDQYTPNNKPNDFHLLALLVYEDRKARDINDFGAKLGFNEDAQKIEFEISNQKGVEFISAGLAKGNPRVAIIFQKESLFYVFNLGFIGGDKEAAEEMEKIAGSFRFY